MVPEKFTLDDVNWALGGGSEINNNRSNRRSGTGTTYRAAPSTRERFGLEDVPGYSSILEGQPIVTSGSRRRPAHGNVSGTLYPQVGRSSFGVEDIPTMTPESGNRSRNLEDRAQPQGRQSRMNDEDGARGRRVRDDEEVAGHGHGHGQHQHYQNQQSRRQNPYPPPPRRNNEDDEEVVRRGRLSNIPQGLRASNPVPTQNLQRPLYLGETYISTQSTTAQAPYIPNVGLSTDRIQNRNVRHEGVYTRGATGTSRGAGSRSQSTGSRAGLRVGLPNPPPVEAYTYGGNHSAAYAEEEIAKVSEETSRPDTSRGQIMQDRRASIDTVETDDELHPEEQVDDHQMGLEEVADDIQVPQDTQTPMPEDEPIPTNGVLGQASDSRNGDLPVSEAVLMEKEAEAESISSTPIEDISRRLEEIILSFDPDHLPDDVELGEKATIVGAVGKSVVGDEPVRTRPYQQEMFELSLERNIILCQPTGSGKTHVAVLRIRHELEHSPPDEISWFLTPSRLLCEQQFQVLERDLPPVQMRLLSGADGVEKWNKKIWEEILGTEETPLEDRVRVVVSTHQILLDALTHGFVNMKHLCLIVFDEAHHCIYSHPANKIMQGFYHPARYRDEKVPVIMGLTASPLFNGGVEDLSMVEQNLDAICRTPLASRSSLQSHSRLPILKPVGYGSINQTSHPLPSASFPSLMEAYNRMDIGSDPYILSLPRETEEDERAYQQAIRRGSTECRKFIKNLFNKLTHLNQEYGSWAADFYIHKVIEMYTAAVKDRGDVLIGYVDAEKMYILEVLSQIRTFEMTDKHLIQPGAMTPKVEKLISILVEEYGPEFAASNSTFAGLIFVEQRVAVSVVAEILSRHPKTKDIFRCGSLLGSSAFQKSKDLVDLVDQKGTKTTLADFKSGQKNLLIATSVAEEGLDVQACNLVVSTYLPNTKKSYVQMRGRARRVNSTYVLMYENAEIGELALNKLSEWEKTMIQAYEDQTRELILPEEEDDEQLYDKYKIERTGALLTFESVIPHLHHFCAVIPRSTSAGIMPEFSSYRLDDGFGLWRAEVTLPSCIPPELRKHQASHNWNKQKTAEQDAAFNAYIALHKAGLVDDNFMPLPTHDPELEMDEIEKKSASKTVPLQLDPWDTTWNETSNGEYEVYISEVRIIWDEADFADIHMLLPFPCPKIATFYLWWTNTQPVQILVQEAPTPTFISSDQFSKAQDTTYTLFTSVFGNRMETDKKDFPYLFTPLEDISKERVPAVEAFHNWATMGAGDIGIVRDVSQNKRPFLFKAWNHEATITPEEMEKRWSKYELIPDMPLLEVTPIPKRRNFSHKGTNGLDIEMEEEERERIHDALTFFLLPEACTFDKLPWRLSKVALLIPCILRRVEMYAIAQELQRTILEPADLRDIEGIVTAITATSSREFTNYQKYEILGDSVLKFLAGIQLLADYPLWHEGYLSGRKDRSVANSKLATESVRLGMSRFIITGLFSATKWRPKYLTPLPPRGGVKKEEMALGEEGMGAGVNDNQGKEDEVQAVAEEKKVTERSLSTKILADIVESLMGAAFLEGGFNKAMQVAKVFGLSMKWDTLENRIEMLLKRAMEVEDFVFPAYLRNMEEMIGYTFKHKPLLLEAITHPGCNADTVVVSYQRLEFLGDSVLDMAIVDRLFRSPMDYGHVDIHLYKSASVNADFLAFLCLNLSLTIENAPVKATVDNKTGEVVVVSEDTRIPFHKFLRHSTREVAHSQALAHKNYLALRDDILDEFEASPHYPWTKLSALTAEKFFSDMVESIIGAVFIDSHGDWEAVDQVMQRFMILPVLDSLLERNADPRHPITKVGVHAAKTLSRTKYVMGIENNALTCEVYVNDVLMGKAVEGLSRAEVRTRAAEIAYFEMLRRDAERVDGQEEELSKKERKKRKGKGKEKVVENEDEIGKPLENEKENEKQITTDEPIEIKKKKKRKGKGKEKENVMEGISQVEVEKEAEQQRPRQDRVEDLVEASTIEKRKRAERERTSSSTEDLGITRTERKRRKTIEMENDTEVDLEKLNNLKEPVDPDALAAMMVTMLSI